MDSSDLTPSAGPLWHAQGVGQTLGKNDVVRLLEATEKEEIASDATLSKFGIQSANLKAA
jgi:hypothetical protein